MDAGRLASTITGALLEASVAGGLAIALVWLIGRHGQLSPRWQVVIWWAASLKLLAVLAGAPAIPVPVLPAAHPASDVLMARPGPEVARAPAYAPALAPHLFPGAETTATTVSVGETATRLLAGVWLLGVAVAGIRLCISGCRVRRLVHRAGPVDAATAGLTERLAARAGLRRVPAVLLSPDVRAPQTVGALRPVILLPAASHDGWTAGERRMALAHELAHVRRRDLLWGWVPVLAESLFFFHPLARLAGREYLLAREAACDAEAIDTSQAAPDDYARLLVRLGIHERGSPLAAGGASGSRSVLARRLEMLVHAPSIASRPGRVALAALAVVALLPMEIAARQAEPPRQVTAARQTEAPRPVTAAPAAPDRAPRPVTVAPAPPAAARPAPPAPALRLRTAPARRARPVARAAQAAPQTPPSPTAPSPAPSPAPPTAAPTPPDGSTLQRELEAARRSAEESAREAADAAREMRALERILQEERARTTLREATRRLERTQTTSEVEARLALEASRNALRAQQNASPDAAGITPDERLRSLRRQFELLVAQQQSLLKQQQELSEQQQAVAEAQRRLAEQLARMRERLDGAR